MPQTATRSTSRTTIRLEAISRWRDDISKHHWNRSFFQHSSTTFHQGKTKWLHKTRCRRRNPTTLQSTSRSMAERRTKYCQQTFYILQMYSPDVEWLIDLQQLHYWNQLEFHFYRFDKFLENVIVFFLQIVLPNIFFCKLLIWTAILQIAVVGHFIKFCKLLLQRIFWIL